MSDCDNCGRDDGHWIGCLAAQAAELESIDVSDLPEVCGFGDCQNPRAISKGPRPAKYCETHKTGSKK